MTENSNTSAPVKICFLSINFLRREFFYDAVRSHSGQLEYFGPLLRYGMTACRVEEKGTGGQFSLTPRSTGRGRADQFGTEEKVATSYYRLIAMSSPQRVVKSRQGVRRGMATTKKFSRELRGLREWDSKERGVSSNQEVSSLLIRVIRVIRG